MLSCAVSMQQREEDIEYLVYSMVDSVSRVRWLIVLSPVMASQTGAEMEKVVSGLITCTSSLKKVSSRWRL